LVLVLVTKTLPLHMIELVLLVFPAQTDRFSGQTAGGKGCPPHWDTDLWAGSHLHLPCSEFVQSVISVGTGYIRITWSWLLCVTISWCLIQLFA